MSSVSVWKTFPIIGFVLRFLLVHYGVMSKHALTEVIKKFDGEFFRSNYFRKNVDFFHCLPKKTNKRIISQLLKLQP